MIITRTQIDALIPPSRLDMNDKSGSVHKIIDHIYDSLNVDYHKAKTFGTQKKRVE